MSSEKPRLLVVDDEIDVCHNLADIFAEFDFQVDVAHDGPSALQLVQKSDYDVALLDLKMPGMDGLELYRRIREISADTVAIIVTAYASSETAQSALDAGAWRILSKPVDFPQLLSLVSEAVDQPLVLVVDDDHDLCDTLWDLFREQGYRVSVACDLDEARQQASRKSHHVVLIDMKLPKASGAEVMQMVRRENPDARIVLVTGHRSELEDLVQKTLRAGADDVCYKPFDVDRLLGIIRAMVEKKAG
jgi:DNA-binding response OmpR family regulator